MTAARTDNRRRSYWLKTLHEWHWVSSAICLIGMILFSVTGFTLNHAGQIEAKPAITMPELAARLREEHGIVAAPAMLSRFLCRRGFSYKKIPDGGGVRTRRRAG